MSFSRRKFLGSAGLVAVSALSWARKVQAEGWPQTEPTPDCLLLDLKHHCSLSESLAGFEKALAESRVQYVKAGLGLFSKCQTILVPGGTGLDSDLMGQLRRALQGGSCLLFESGLGYSDSTEFVAHQDLLRSHFQVEIERPVNLWPQSRNQHAVPYVELRWPHPTMIRDFSRAVPLSGPATEMIGWAQGRPIALKRQLGKGTLVFLGSPLGPALLAGDPEAQGWFRALRAIWVPAKKGP